MSGPADPDLSIRLAAFEAIGRLVARHGPVLEWKVLAGGFLHGEKRLLFANRARGIFRPVGMERGALSIKTTVPRTSRRPRYEDVVASTGHFSYAFQGTDPDAHDNGLLQATFDLRSPLIYLFGIAPSRYRPIWPVYVTHVDRQGLRCTIQADEAATAAPSAGAASPERAAIVREYVTQEVKRRLHQEAFREQVLEAYDSRCAVCRLPSPRLLQAAHILPDRDVRGVPEVPNGLALCHLHHAAYDADLLGISQRGVIAIARTIRDLEDGPTLEHGLKAFDQRSITLPRDPRDAPRSDYLAERFERFTRAG